MDRRTAILRHHEASHLIAAMSLGLKWHTATIESSTNAVLGELDGYVSFDPTSFEALDALQRAFVMYAGPYAAARIAGRPVAETLRTDACSHDLAYVEPYLTRAITKEWNTTLDRLWPTISLAAHYLLVFGSIRNPEMAGPREQHSGTS